MTTLPPLDTSKTGTPWTVDDDRVLRELASNSSTMAHIATQLHRTEGSILGRIQVSAYKMFKAGVSPDVICAAWHLSEVQLVIIVDNETQKRTNRRRHGQMLSRTPRCEWY